MYTKKTKAITILRIESYIHFYACYVFGVSRALFKKRLDGTSQPNGLPGARVRNQHCSSRGTMRESWDTKFQLKKALECNHISIS